MGKKPKKPEPESLNKITRAVAAWFNKIAWSYPERLPGTKR